MQFKTLETLTISELTNLFNLAFADYFVKIELTTSILKEKIRSEDIQLDLSVGAFAEGKPVGFIFHAIRNVNNKKVAYNAGTGIIPEFRGNKTTVKMYRFIQPVLLKNGVEKVELEVMEQNIAAIKSYLNAGFQKVKNLECFNGKANLKNFNPNVTFQKTVNSEITNLNKFWDWSPSWQHATQTIIQSSVYETFNALLNDDLVGYAVVVPKTGRVAQFAVKPDLRKQGVGKAIFKHLSEITPEGLSLINIDGNNEGTLQFLKKIGLNHFLRQFKMEFNLIPI